MRWTRPNCSHQIKALYCRLREEEIIANIGPRVQRSARRLAITVAAQLRSRRYHVVRVGRFRVASGECDPIPKAVGPITSVRRITVPGEQPDRGATGTDVALGDWATRARARKSSYRIHVIMRHDASSGAGAYGLPTMAEARGTLIRRSHFAPAPQPVVLDPYGVVGMDPECDCIGTEYFARVPGTDVWIMLSNLPDRVREAIWAKHGNKLAFLAGLWFDRTNEQRGDFSVLVITADRLPPRLSCAL